MPMYIVMSYDFGGTATVKIHCTTASLEIARARYTTLADTHRIQNMNRIAANAGSTLIELAEVPDDFDSDAGHTLFWGEDSAVQTIMSNNAV